LKVSAYKIQVLILNERETLLVTAFAHLQLLKRLEVIKKKRFAEGQTPVSSPSEKAIRRHHSVTGQ
jgi:Fe2+ or Zn2+ uptake regulation protein